MIFENKKNEQTGLTIMETSVYLGLFTLMMLLLFALLSFVYSANLRFRLLKETTDNARMAMDMIAYEIKEANSVYASTTNSSQLSLRTDHYIMAGEADSFLDIFVCGTQLCLKKEGQAEPVVLTSGSVVVKELSFIRFSATSSSPAVQIGLRLESKNPIDRFGAHVSVNVTSTASLRSY